MNKETHENITKLITCLENPNKEYFAENIQKYSECNDIIRADNPSHNLVAKTLNMKMVGDVLNPKNDINKGGNVKSKIKYKSQINMENLENVSNLTLWKNVPSTNHLFNAQTNVRPGFIHKNGQNNIEDFVEKKQNNYQRKFKVSNIEDINDEEKDPKINSERNNGNYMSTTNFNLKRKK